MATDNNQSQDVDLDRTDRLPILEGTLYDADVEDDAVRMEQTAVVPPATVLTGRIAHLEFPRSSSIDLPSLAESVRSVEERIARQTADYEALNRSYEKAKEAEAAAVIRANALAADLLGARVALESEQMRARDIDRALQERTAAAEAARTRIEDSLREAQRLHGESKTLRESLAARDATIVQVLHSLGERDAQLSALQRDHAHIVPALEERAKAGAKLDAELKGATALADRIALDLTTARAETVRLATALKRSEIDLDGTRHELGIAKTQAASFLEHLRTREWRRGFDENMFRETDVAASVVQLDLRAMRAERDRLQHQVESQQEKLATHEASIGALTAAVTADAAAREQQSQQLKERESARLALLEQLATLEADRDRLGLELHARDAEVLEARARATAEALKVRDQLAAAEKTHADLAALVQQLRSEAAAHDQEMTVLMAHLHEARRPIQSIEADLKRVTDELAQKTLSLEQLTEENRSLRGSLERTRGALEEREFLIRRLERSESTNANVLGRIQTSIERLGAPDPGGAAPAAAAPMECTAELLRLDGSRNTSHPLSRRTRVGRAPGCELQIDSSSVSRHHALVLMSTREVIIEDLNSTNGVIVNGRKISRQLLNDGDVVMIGEAQFRLAVKLAPRTLQAPQPEND